MKLSKSKILPQEFYSRDTLTVARELLGKRLARRYDDGQIVSGQIVEVEAYTHDDPACHAFIGKTARNAVMFGPAGFAYVYFIYGMYHCLNVVTEENELPGAVLIRAVDHVNTNGPGKLCKYWQITREHNGLAFFDPKSPIWIEDNSPIDKKNVVISKRIGIKQAADRPWRYYVKDNPSVSRK